MGCLLAVCSEQPSLPPAQLFTTRNAVFQLLISCLFPPLEHKHKKGNLSLCLIHHSFPGA